jgi:hypothetical protein
MAELFREGNVENGTALSLSLSPPISVPFENIFQPSVLVAAVEEHFDMPRAIVAEAVNELGDLQDPWT